MLAIPEPPRRPETIHPPAARRPEVVEGEEGEGEGEEGEGEGEEEGERRTPESAMPSLTPPASKPAFIPIPSPSPSPSPAPHSD